MKQPAESKPTPAVIIHTDGGCHGNPGPGGWAAVLQYGSRKRELSGAEPATTNNRMELTAAIAALEALKRPCAVELYTDSQYLRNGVTKWIQKWKRARWLTAEKTPVRNKDLWVRLDALTQRHQINWRWLKGHAGHRMNERCDQLAAQAIKSLRSKHTPESLKQALKTFRKRSQ